MTYRQKLWIAIRWQWRWVVLRRMAIDSFRDIWESLNSAVICFVMFWLSLLCGAVLLALFLPRLIWLWSGQLLYIAVLWDSKEFERLEKRMARRDQ